MPYYYSDPRRESEKFAQPDVWVTDFTADEAVDMFHHEDFEAFCQRKASQKKPKFRDWKTNSETRARAMEAFIEWAQIEPCWGFNFCFPGCCADPDGWSGPYDTEEEAEAAMREQHTPDDYDPEEEASEEESDEAEEEAAEAAAVNMDYDPDEAAEAEVLTIAGLARQCGSDE